MFKNLIVSFTILITMGCQDDSEVITPSIENEKANPDTSSVESTAFFDFEGEWLVEEYRSTICEISSGDCHELILDKTQQPLYKSFEFLENETIGITSTNEEEVFRATYLNQNQILLENDATDSGEWEGTFIVYWLEEDQFTMSNSFNSQDSTYLHTDVFHLTRRR